ncbi:MAG: SsrA-binding protein SmpB [Actinobacteria bacterium]|nr:SsrA-binding protein SmpB [Actinomycetota bacterium]
MGKKNSKRKSEEGKAIVATNKKALKDFFILDRYEAGIALKGSEVKSVREHRVNLKDSYARIKNGEMFLYNVHISPYSKSRVEESNPTRVRKILMHKKEIDRIAGKLADKSLTLVPLSMYFSGGWVKVELALAKGKTKVDRRRDIQEREHKKEIEREVRRAFKKM